MLAESTRSDGSVARLRVLWRKFVETRSLGFRVTMTIFGLFLAGFVLAGLVLVGMYLIALIWFLSLA